MKRLVPIAVLASLALVLLSGCTPEAARSAEPHPAGFWKGLWHGFILVFTFLVSLFEEGVGVYEVHNNGNLYDLGYVLGAMAFFGGGCGGARKR